MTSETAAAAPTHPTFREAFRFWLKLGFISFGGPTGQIAIMHTELVEKKRWISESRFLHALNYCMLLPGPEAQQLATYIGWLLHGTAGGIVAGSLFVLPSAFILWALSYGYMMWGSSPLVAAIFLGLKPAVLAIVAAAAIRIGRKALKNEIMWGIAALAFVAIFFFRLPFPLIVATAGFIGWFGGRVAPERFNVTLGHAPESHAVLHDQQELHESGRNPWARSLRVIGTCTVLWWTPILLIAAWLGWEHSISQQGLFFSKAAMVTFGGAYAVLPYVAQQAVERYGWLTAPQMLDGLGLAETTPGPLIMVLQFVGFVGGWQQPGQLSPVIAATLGAAVTTWVTFIPCFLWIFLGAPHIEAMRGNSHLNAALSGVTAAVVGVILNLALWFGWHILAPAGQPFNAFGLAVALIAFVGLVRWKWDVIPVVLGAGFAGVIWHLFATK